MVVFSGFLTKNCHYMKLSMIIMLKSYKNFPPQRVLEHCHNPKTQHIMMDEIFLNVCMLAQDQYGNYVVQVCY